MNKKFIYLFILILTFFTSSSTQEQEQEASIYIRVLLEDKDYKSKEKFDIESQSGLLISIPDAKDILYKGRKLTVSLNDLKFKLTSSSNPKDSREFNSKYIKLKPIENKFILNKSKYQGELILYIDKSEKKLYIINRLKLDDYLYSVILAEGYPTWPEEMQKLQAIVSRSYALNNIIKARKLSKNKKPYDIRNNNFHQKYNGHHNYTYLRKAIEETKNLVLTYNNQVILAMFDVCCGGLIPAKASDIDFFKAPYLARHEVCDYCKNFEYYKWQVVFREKDFVEKLKNKLNIKKEKLGEIKSIDILKKDNAGKVYQIKFKFDKRNITLTGNELKNMFSNYFKSINFTIKKENKSIIINGHGYGHQMGLCQHGAKALIDAGWPIKKILKHYYPNTKLAKLKICQDTNLTC